MLVKKYCSRETLDNLILSKDKNQLLCLHQIKNCSYDYKTSCA